MELITITSFFNLLASFICIAAALKIFIVIRNKKRESINIRYFFYAFLFISIYLLIGVLPLFIEKNPYFIVFFIAFFRSFLVIGGMFLMLITINLSKIKLLDSIYVYVTISVVLFSSILTILGISEISGNIFLQESTENLMRPDNILIIIATIITGLYFSLSVLIAFIFYLRFALREKLNKVALGKAIMMSIGCLMFFCAGLIKYIVGIDADNFILTSVAASFLFMMGSISFIASVNYKGEKKNYKFNQKLYARPNETSKADV